MLSLMKDLPLIDTIAPIAIAGLAWTGVNIFYVGPEIVGSRMADKTWLPQCEATVARTETAYRQQWQARVENARREKQREQAQINGLTGALLGGLLGEEFNRAFGHNITGALGALSELEAQRTLKDRFGTSAPPSPITAGYCKCMVSEALEDRVSAGLYSASLRIWKPANIKQLNQLGTQLVSSNRCGFQNQ